MNENKFINCSVLRYDSVKNNFVADNKNTSIECSLSIYVNGNKLTESYCSPFELEDLVVGMLAQMNKINTFDDIIDMEVDYKQFTANVKIKDNISINTNKTNNNVKFCAKDILNCADELLSKLSKTHEVTNGVHSGVIFDGKDILIYREDIGRHNVFDKLYGWSLRNHIDLSDKIIVFSGRCSSEMMKKLGHMGVPAVAAKSVPTTLSISMAKKFGITLAARMNPGSFCIYTYPERIVL